jgi:hypothetical protein
MVPDAISLSVPVAVLAGITCATAAIFGRNAALAVAAALVMAAAAGFAFSAMALA